MKILLINNLYAPNAVGGAEKSVEQLCFALEERELDVRVLSLGSTNTDINYYINFPFLKKIWPVNKKRNFIQRSMFQFFSDYFSFHIKRKIIDVFDEFSPSVVHTNNLAGIGDWVWKLCADRDIKVVHTLRDYYQMCARQTCWQEGKGLCETQCTKCRLITTPRKIYSQYVNYVVGNSNHTLQCHIDASYFKRAKVAVVSGGLDPYFLGLNIKSKPFDVLGFIGQIIPTKGIETLLEFAIKNELKLLIAGDGDENYINQLKFKYSCNNIEWLGRVNPVIFFSNISILVVPSLWPEPLPRVIYEAYAFGIPVLASNVGGNPDVIHPDHHNFLFDAGSVISLTEAYESYNISTKTISGEDLREYSKEFSRDRIVDKYILIYEEVLDENRFSS